MPVFTEEVQDHLLATSAAGIEELITLAFETEEKEKALYLAISALMLGERLPLKTMIYDLQDELIKIKNENRRRIAEAESASEDAYFNCTSRV